MGTSSVLAEDDARGTAPAPPPNDIGIEADAGGAAMESRIRERIVETFRHRVDNLISKADELEQMVNEIVQFYASKKQPLMVYPFHFNLLMPVSGLPLMANGGCKGRSRTIERVMLIGFIILCSGVIPFCPCLGSGGDSNLGGGSCIESERRALLAIRADINSYDEWLSSWTGEDCCQWRGVGCNNTTGHVVKLNLDTLMILMMRWKELQNPQDFIPCFGRNRGSGVDEEVGPAGPAEFGPVGPFLGPLLGKVLGPISGQKIKK